MKPTINTLRGIISFIVVASAFLISCNKQADLIGLDLLPPGDKLNVALMDTTTIVAYSIYDVPFRTDELVTSQAMIGSVADPVFGKTAATFYTQFQMLSAAPAFGTNPVCDSMVLVLPYLSLFGDSTALQTFRVYELSETLHLDSVYYSNMHAEYNQSSLLAQQTFLPRVKDSVRVDAKTKVAPLLRLKFNPALGSRILAASANDLSNNDNFIKFFKGIAVTAADENTPGKGSLVSFNLTSTYSRLRMYYHNTADTATYDLVIGTSCSRFNQYNHFGHASASPAFRAQLSGDTTSGQQKLYIQALGGTKIKLRFPYLKKWASDKNIAINDAQLIMTNGDASAPYAAPSKLGMVVLYKDGNVNYTIDELVEGTDHFDGTLNASKGYRFRISRYIQQLLKPQADDLLAPRGLYLFVSNVPNAFLQYNRLVLNGTGKQNTGHIKLEIRYTVIPK